MQKERKDTWVKNRAKQSHLPLWKGCLFSWGLSKSTSPASSHWPY